MNLSGCCIRVRETRSIKSSVRPWAQCRNAPFRHHSSGSNGSFEVKGIGHHGGDPSGDFARRHAESMNCNPLEIRESDSYNLMQQWMDCA